MYIRVGDVIFLRYNTLAGEEGSNITKIPHMFVILKIKDNMLHVYSTSSREDKVSYKYPYNVPLEFAIEAGFKKPGTHVKTDRFAKVSFNDIYKVVGHLTPSDLNRCKEMANKCPKHKQVELENLFDLLRRYK